MPQLRPRPENLQGSHQVAADVPAPFCRISRIRRADRTRVTRACWADGPNRTAHIQKLLGPKSTAQDSYTVAKDHAYCSGSHQGRSAHQGRRHPAGLQERQGHHPPGVVPPTPGPVHSRSASRYNFTNSIHFTSGFGCSVTSQYRSIAAKAICLKRSLKDMASV